MPKITTRLQKGFTIIELLIVIAIIGILAGLVLTNFQGANAKGRDVTRKDDINIIHSKLEEYHNNQNGYPDGVLSTTVLPGIDADALKDADGNSIAYTDGFVVANVAPNPAVSNTAEYVYAAYSCTNAGAQATVGATCQKYVLKTFLEKDPAGSYTKNSLN